MSDVSKERVEAMRQELSDLSRLNAAMFRQIFASDPVSKRIFAARYDTTDPQADDCQTERGWDLRIEGDFFLVKRVGGFIYVIVGDATGHHAYAGGLKVFVAAALKSIFDRFLETRPPSATLVLKKLSQFFIKVGEAALLEDSKRPLEHGVEAAVIRIDQATRSVKYASAGLPVFALRSNGATKYAEFSDGNGITFPADSRHPGVSKSLEGTIDVRDVRFLAVATDGFRSLKRRPVQKVKTRTESFGETRLRDSLISGVQKSERGELAGGILAATVASVLVESAKQFRKGFMIPEEADDDRLIVVVDLDEVWRWYRQNGRD